VDGKTQTSSHEQKTFTDNSGTTIHTISQGTGKDNVDVTERYDAKGHLLESGNDQQRITDVDSDVDAKYKEAMEDEYAKREGGA